MKQHPILRPCSPHPIFRPSPLQVEGGVGLLAEELSKHGVDNSYSLSYQGQIGPEAVPWTEPATSDTITQLGQVTQPLPLLSPLPRARPSRSWGRCRSLCPCHPAPSFASAPMCLPAYAYVPLTLLLLRPFPLPHCLRSRRCVRCSFAFACAPAPASTACTSCSRSSSSLTSSPSPQRARLRCFRWCPLPMPLPLSCLGPPLPSHLLFLVLTLKEGTRALPPSPCHCHWRPLIFFLLLAYRRRGRVRFFWCRSVSCLSTWARSTRWTGSWLTWQPGCENIKLVGGWAGPKGTGRCGRTGARTQICKEVGGVPRQVADVAARVRDNQLEGSWGANGH
jgi:hypothetical protein